MFTIDQRWAMVEYHGEYEGNHIYGYLWWNTQGDRIFQKNPGENQEFYQITDDNGEGGIAKVINTMTLLDPEEVVLQVQV